jgi:hypothetical protein
MIRVSFPDLAADSMPLALLAILKHAGGDAEYRALHVALGLPFMIAVRDSGQCFATWPTEGRDAFLLDTAKAFGFRLRALHPPEAAVGLESAPEFGQHFEASYLPLIEAALRNGQPVLARRGWPDGAASAWGVITGTAEEGVGLRGTTTTADGEAVGLTEPPVQAYVVEEVTPRGPTEDELLKLAVSHACVAIEGGLRERLGLTTGLAAYDVLGERLLRDPACPSCGARSCECFARLVSAVLHAKEVAIDFFGRQSGRLAGASPGAGTAAVGIADACKAVCADFNRIAAVDVVREMFGSEVGRAELVDAVDAMRTMEGFMLEDLRTLDRSLSG